MGGFTMRDTTLTVIKGATTLSQLTAIARDQGRDADGDQLPAVAGAATPSGELEGAVMLSAKQSDSVNASDGTK
jgi:hypothetical protein